MFEGAKVEVHLSNPYARERWRHRSVLSPVVDGTITGLKATGYRLAIEAAAALIEEKPEARGRKAGIPTSSEPGPERPGLKSQERKQ
jgi:hypothetical protein